MHITLERFCWQIAPTSTRAQNIERFGRERTLPAFQQINK